MRVKDGSFPAPLRISAGAVAWREADIEHWIGRARGGRRPVSDYRDLVIEMLAGNEAELLERVDDLLTIIAAIAHENFLLREVWHREWLKRINGDGQLARERQRRFRETRAAV